MQTYFENRSEAGKELAKALSHYKDHSDTLVLALPRGGVPVAFEVAHALHLPLDLMLVRKLGVPGHEELAMGAIALGDVEVFNEEVIESLIIPPRVIKAVMMQEYKELLRRNEVYRQGRPPADIKNRTVILIDDGMATGANMRAAVTAASRQKPARIVVAAPVASDTALKVLETLADEVIVPHCPTPFQGVGGAYAAFPQNTDNEVVELLKAHSRTTVHNSLTFAEKGTG